MANKPLGRAWYALYRETENDAGRTVKDPFGYFSCRLNVARFLDIEDVQFTGTIFVKRNAGTRTNTLADGTVLTTSTANSDAKNAETLVPLRRTVGGKSVILQTGKRIYPNDEKKQQRHTLSFAFPAWADARTISEALGEIIPATKIKASPTAADIYPTWKYPGGGTYGIMQKAPADTSQKTNTSSTALKQKAAAKGGEVIDGAGN